MSKKMKFKLGPTFIVLIKELGIKDMLKSAAIMIFVAIVVGGLMNLLIRF